VVAVPQDNSTWYSIENAFFTSWMEALADGTISEWETFRMPTTEDSSTQDSMQYITERCIVEDEVLRVLREAALVCFWHGFRGIPADFAQRYVFFNNYEYSFFANTMNQTSRERGHSGTWRIIGNELELTVIAKQILVGGEPAWCTVKGGHWRGATLETITLEEPEIRHLTLSDILIADSILPGPYGNHRIEIGGEEFWKFNFFVDLYEMFYPEQWH